MGLSAPSQSVVPSSLHEWRTNKNSKKNLNRTQGRRPGGGGGGWGRG